MREPRWHCLIMHKCPLCCIGSRYDVEQFQKIEALTGQRMDKYDCEEEAALLLLERVGEAQKLATMQACALLHVQGMHACEGVPCWARCIPMPSLPFF